MRDRKIFEENDLLFLLLEKLMHQNVEAGKYENKEESCDAIVASLLLSSKEREKRLAQLFENTTEFERYAEELNEKENRDALIKCVAVLCKRYSKPLNYQVRPVMSGLVKQYTNIRKGASFHHFGLSRAVATVLSDGYDANCYIGKHLLEMNKNERSLFRLLDRIRTLMGKSRIGFSVEEEYSSFSEEELKKILALFVRDSPIEMTLTNKTLNDYNRAAYEILLTSENELDLTLAEGGHWHNEDISFIINALKKRKSVIFNCDMVPHSEGHVHGYLNCQIIQHITGVEVKVYDTVSTWKSNAGSWRDFADLFYKKMAKGMHRKFELHDNGVIFHAVKPKESIHSLFARKILRRDEATLSVQRKPS